MFEFKSQSPNEMRASDGYGNYSADPVRFPNGLRPVSDAAHSAGLRLILWFEPERAMRGSNEAFRVGEANGYLRCTNSLPCCWGTCHVQQSNTSISSCFERQCLFYFGAPGAKQWMQQKLSSLITEYGVDIYRQDRNGAAPYGFWTEGDAPDRRGMSELLHINGLYDLLDGLRAEHPALSMDNCASGGRRLDIEMSRRMVPLHRTDWQPQGPPVQTSTPAQGITLGKLRYCLTVESTSVSLTMEHAPQG